MKHISTVLRVKALAIVSWGTTMSQGTAINHSFGRSRIARHDAPHRRHDARLMVAGVSRMSLGQSATDVSRIGHA